MTSLGSDKVKALQFSLRLRDTKSSEWSTIGLNTNKSVLVMSLILAHGWTSIWIDFLVFYITRESLVTLSTYRGLQNQ